jgi:hypothetical protein
MAVIPVEKKDGANAPPDPDLMRKDPMAEMFGPGSNVKLIGDREDQVPDEVRAVLDEFGLSKKSFQCILKEMPEGSTVGDESSSTNAAYIKGWVRSIPSTEWIARNYGPGTYILFFMWRNKDESTDGKSVAMHQEVTVVISDKYMEEFKQHRLNAKLRQASEMGSKVRDTMLEKELENKILGPLGGAAKENEDPAKMAKAYISEIMDTAKMIGLSPLGAQQPAKQLDWEKILPPLVTVATAFMTMRQNAQQSQQAEFNKLLLMMMAQGQQANTQLMEVMKLQTGVGTGASQFKEIKDMIFGAMDIKAMMAGEQKETVADRIFRIVEGVAPQILSIASTAAAAQAARANPLIKKTIDGYTSGPDFEALKKDPAEMKKAVDKFDNFFGWEQTDAILAIAGWPRPAECPHDPAKQYPAQQQPQVPGGGPDISDGEIVEDN